VRVCKAEAVWRVGIRKRLSEAFTQRLLGSNPSGFVVNAEPLVAADNTRRLDLA
jgi:hypothetical protein